MKLKPWQKNVLSALVIMGVGFLLFNAAFLLAAGVYYVMAMLAGASEMGPYIYGSFHRVFLVLILLLSLLILRLKLPDLFKATFLTMPLMVVLVELGIQLYGKPQWMTLLIGAVIVGVVLFFLYVKKLPWLYYFATLYVTVLALYVALAGIEI